MAKNMESFFLLFFENSRDVFIEIMLLMNQNIIISYKMTSASFYKQNDRNSSNGVYFDIPEDQLGKELQRRKNQEVSRGIQLEKLVS